MKRTFKYYLKLNQTQRKKLDYNLEFCCRFYNYLMEEFRERDKNKQKQLTKFQLINSIIQIKKDNPIFKQVHSSTLQEIAKQVYEIWKRNEELKKIDSKKGYPNFKKPHRYNSFIYSQSIDKSSCGYKIDNASLAKKRENKKLKLTLGRQSNKNVYLTVRIRMERNFQGNCKTLTIKRKNGKYYALFSCENIPTRSLPKTNKVGGFDLGIKHLIIADDGSKVKNPKFYKKAEKGITETQKALSRKETKSKNWLKTKSRLAKQWERLVNQSKHYIRQEVNKIVKNYDIVKVEDLNVKGMLEKKLGDGKKSLRRSLMGTKFGLTLKTFAEAAEIATRQLIRVDPKNTTQKCSNCQVLSELKLTLWDRTYKCWNCKLELDRDVNAARNILNSPATSSIGTCPSQGEIF